MADFKYFGKAGEDHEKRKAELERKTEKIIPGSKIRKLEENTRCCLKGRNRTRLG